MADPFGVMGSTVWRSRRFRPLADPARTLYFYLHANPHRNAIGLYRLPLVWIADDIAREVDYCRDAMADLVSAGLADFDATEALVRVRNWEFKNAPQGPQEAVGRMLKGFDEAPRHDYTGAAFLCFARDVAHRARGTRKAGDGWKESDFRSRMEQMIADRLLALHRDDPHSLARAFMLAAVDPADVAFESLWHRVSDTGTIPEGYPMVYTDTDLRSQITDHRSQILDHGSQNTDHRTRITLGRSGRENVGAEAIEELERRAKGRK